MVAPVAVGADPDLEQRRLALDDRPARGRGERPDPGPDQTSENPSASSTLPRPAGALAVDEAEPLRRRLGLGHARPDQALHVVHRGRRDVVREAHPLDLLRGLHRARLGEQRRRVDRVRERVEPGLREGRRLAHHAIRSPACRATARARPPRTARRRDAATRARAPAADEGRRVVAARRAARRSSRRVRSASSADASRQTSVGSPSRGKTTAS